MKKFFTPIYFFLLSLMFLGSTTSGIEPPPETILQVGILEKVSSFNLSAEGDYTAVEMNSSKEETLSSRNVFLVESDKDSLIIGELSMTAP